MKNLLIIQNYNANKGDSSVVHTMKMTLLEMDEQINIRLTSYDPEMAFNEYGLESAERIISFKKVKFAKSKFMKIYYFIKEFIWVLYSLVWLLFYKIDIKLPLPKSKKKSVHFYLISEVVVLPGGHFFTNFNGFHVNVSHAYGLLFAKMLNKKTMIYAQTIGPFFGKFGSLTKKMTDYVIRHTDIVSVREEDSLKYCKEYNNVHVTAETVFALPSDKNIAVDLPDLEKLKQSSKPVVGVTIHHIYYKHFFTREEYIELMAKLFDGMIEEFDCNILIIPMEADYHEGGDRPIASEMIALCNKKDNIYILKGDHDPIVTSSVIANMDIFVGTKTHSIVYGLKSNVPTISISYQQKSNEFMKMFNVLENAINLKNLNEKDFMDIFKRVVAKKDFYKEMEKKMYASVKNKALHNNVLLYSLFDNKA